MVSGGQPRDSAIHMHVSTLLPFRLPRNTEQISLCYIVGPCWLPILSCCGRAPGQRLFCGGAPREKRDRGVAGLGMGERTDRGEGPWGEEFGVEDTLEGENSVIFGEFGSGGLLGMGTAVD